MTFARAAKTFASAAAITTSVAVAAGIRGIVSESMPRGVYYSHAFRGAVQPGDTVEVCLPPDISRLARTRGYLARGIFCPDGVQRIVKEVLAVSGDTVEVTLDGLRARGRLQPHTAARHLDSRGRHLNPVPPGRYIVQPGTLWLFSTEVETSFDSRYFGPIPESAIRRRFHPLWTEPHRSPPSPTSRR